MQPKQEKIIQFAQQLFLEKGYFSVSVQDIIDASGISKGTFYNYFHSKSDLVLALLQHIKRKVILEREEIKQNGNTNKKDLIIELITVKLSIHKKNRVFSLYESLILEDNQELRNFIQSEHMSEVRWISERLVELYGDTIKLHSFDLATSFLGALHHQLRMAELLKMEDKSLEKFIHYNFNCLEGSIPQIVEKKQLLFNEALVEIANEDYWEHSENIIKKMIEITDCLLEEAAHVNEEVLEMLTFISNELKASSPRLFVVTTITRTLSSFKELPNDILMQIMQLLRFVQIYQKQIGHK